MGIETTVRNYVSASTYNELSKLEESKMKDVVAFFDNTKKNFGLSILCWFFGVHYFYFRQMGTGCLFLLTCGGALIWWGIDLFRLKTLMIEANDRILLNHIAEIR